jgi:hypothetical protein
MWAMPRRDLRILLLLSVLALGLAMAQSVVGLSTGFLFMAPAMVMFLPLIAGRCYLGERRLARLTRAVPAPRRAAAPGRGPRRAERRLLPRGGSLLAFSLAVRPPPAASITR